MNPLPQPLCIQLCDHLDAEIGVHRRLLASSEAKTAEIVAHNIPAFTQLLQREQAPVAEMARLRQLRERLMRQVASNLGVKADGLTMSIILTAVQEAMRGDLRRRQQDLTAVIAALRDINQRNMVLIQQSLSFVRAMLHGLVGEKLPKGHPYDRRGLLGASLHGNGRLLNLRG